MFQQFALTHAWLIPLLPALAFAAVGLLLRPFKRLSAAVVVAAGAGAFVLASGVALEVVQGGAISMETPFVQRVPWLDIAGLHIDMGVLIDPLTAMMLVVVTLVTLLVEIYSLGYMHGDPGFSRDVYKRQAESRPLFTAASKILYTFAFLCIVY